jgi:(E)-4-hydroxy-3-methylbut-2-enyl-diphosphate synthase
MTTTSTRDVQATADQVCRLVEVGCEIVRITAPTPRDAHCLGDIRNILDARGVKVPLVADIHFQPAAAMAAADYVDKIRINPGNFADKKVFKLKDYSGQEYDAELRRIEERFLPLVEKCRDLGRAMRIGTNHGSLSDRIMGHYGDTPLGMVESALEFVRICEKANYFELVLSMKASNPQVMIEANRLLAARLDEAGMTYPIHLGVTEAGDGEDGRIKSAIGIGSLLEDGIGDTIRVSLTEEPEHEIPVALSLTRIHDSIGKDDETVVSPHAAPGYDPFDFKRRPCKTISFGAGRIGGEEQIGVEVVIQPHECSDILAIIKKAASEEKPMPESVCLDGAGGLSVSDLEQFCLDLQASTLGCKPALMSDQLDPAFLPYLSTFVMPANDHLLNQSQWTDFLDGLTRHGVHLRLLSCFHDSQSTSLESCAASLTGIVQTCQDAGFYDLSLSVASPGMIPFSRYVLHQHTSATRLTDYPLVLCSGLSNPDQPVLGSAVEVGGTLCDGFGDALSIHAPGIPPAQRLKLAFNILQASGRRITRTDYVACPSCGRTLFDLQSTTERIRAKTDHLKGVKIAIMGCIVNGPGEMADADFGYVGSSPGMISLYVGRECVERNIPQSEADERLIRLIKEHGRWVDPAFAPVATPGS